MNTEQPGKESSRTIDGVIFDFNGTLFLDNDKHVKAWDLISREIRGIGMDEDELHRECNGMPNHMIIRYLMRQKSTPRLEEEYSQKKEALYRDLCRSDPENLHLIAGAEDLFNSLKERNIPFTIASASIKENIDFFIDTFHLDQWIDPSWICYDDGSCDDKTQMLAKACGILKANPEKTVVIEDSLKGVQSALKAGIQDIRIINSAHTPEIFKAFAPVKQICQDMRQIRI